MSIGIPAPPLIGGVTQQSKGLRLESQVAAQDNAWSSVVDGLVKRQPSQHVARIYSNDQGERHCHWIDTGEGRYVALFGEETVTVLDVDTGLAVPVLGPEGAAPDFSYLAFTNGVNVRAVTAGETTFVLNRDTPVTINTSVSNPHFAQIFDRTAYVFIKSGQYDTRYKIKIVIEDNGTPLVHPVTGEEWFEVKVTTWDGSEDPASPTTDIGSIRTNKIASELEGPSTTGDTNSFLDLAGHLATLGYETVTSVTRDGSLIRFGLVNTATPSDLKITEWTVSDSSGDTLMTGWQRETERVTDLPKYAFDGNVVKITGNSDDLDAADDYWVVHVRDDTNAGRWEETVDPNTEIAIDRTEMPHLLVKTVDGDGTLLGMGAGQVWFLFHTEIPSASPALSTTQRWAYMAVGSAENEGNPFPSFVTPTLETNRPLDDIFFWQNRLGILSGQNIIMSEAGVYFNFFRTTVRTLLDSDPIDLTVGHSQLHRLHSAEPEDESLWAYSATTQFEIQSDEILSPRTVRVKPRLSYDNSIDVHPVSTGRGTFFAVSRGDYSGVRELTKIDDATVDAPDVTIQIPAYIDGAITQLSRSTVANVLAVLADGDPTAVYLYRYFWNGNEKVQSAWFRYTFGTGVTVRSVGFFESEMYIAVQRSHGLYLEKLDLEERKSDPSSTWVVSMDRRVTEVGVAVGYNPGTNLTTITWPYAIGTGEVAQVTTRPGGVVLPVVSQGTTVPNSITVAGDYSSAQLWLGVQYTMSVELSPPVLRQSSSRTSFSARVGQRVQVPQGTIAFRDSSYFTVEADGDTATFSAFNPGNPADVVSLETGEFTFPVWQGDTLPVVKLLNDTPHPSNFEEMEWAANTLERTSRWRR